MGAFVRTVGAARQKGDKGKGRGRDYSRGRNERRGRDDTDDRDASPLTRFRDRYPMDDRAFAVLRGSPQSCVDTVLNTFKPRSEGDDDYSALVTTFVRAIRA